MLVGVLVGLPGASYIAALHNLVAGKYSTLTQVVAVVVFVVIEFLLILIPFALLELRPGHQGAAQAHPGLAAGPRLAAHAGIALVLGAYLTISGQLTCHSAPRLPPTGLQIHIFQTGNLSRRVRSGRLRWVDKNPDVLCCECAVEEAG